MSSLETHYSARDIEARILAGIRAAGLDPDRQLAPEDLAALDHFHTGGLRASRELLEVAQIRAEDRVLDIGAGLAGSARLIAAATGCSVECIEMSSDYCAGAMLLNRLTGLGDRIRVHQGSALDLPFPGRSFEVVWMQNVGMNIADKRQLYGEIARVLKPGGRLIFCEHGSAPDEAVRRWQNRLNPIWKRLSGGCNLNVPIPSLLERAGFKIGAMDAMYMPGWKPASFNYWGTAISP